MERFHYSVDTIGKSVFHKGWKEKSGCTDFLTLVSMIPECFGPGEYLCSLNVSTLVSMFPERFNSQYVHQF